MKEPIVRERSGVFRSPPASCWACPGVLSQACFPLFSQRPGLSPAFPSLLQLHLPSLQPLFPPKSSAPLDNLEAPCFSCCSHKSAFNPFRLRLCTDRSLRKIDEGQTYAIMREYSRGSEHLGGLQSSRPHRHMEALSSGCPLLPCPLCALLPTAPLF